MILIAKNFKLHSLVKTEEKCLSIQTEWMNDCNLERSPCPSFLPELADEIAEEQCQLGQIC